jgi:hypothetical protein
VLQYTREKKPAHRLPRVDVMVCPCADRQSR